MKDRVVEVWLENWPVWTLFRRMGTQWRTQGMGGPVAGLDYNVLLRFLDRMDLARPDYDQMLDDIAVLEDAALSALHAA